MLETAHYNTSKGGGKAANSNSHTQEYEPKHCRSYNLNGGLSSAKYSGDKYSTRYRLNYELIYDNGSPNYKDAHMVNNSIYNAKGREDLGYKHENEHYTHFGTRNPR